MKDSLDALKKAKKNLKKLSALSNTGDYTTISISGSTVPERWCPTVTNKVRLQDLPSIVSEKVININGGTP